MIIASLATLVIGALIGVAAVKGDGSRADNNQQIVNKLYSAIARHDLPEATRYFCDPAHSAFLQSLTLAISAVTSAGGGRISIMSAGISTVFLVEPHVSTDDGQSCVSSVDVLGSTSGPTPSPSPTVSYVLAPASTSVSTTSGR